MKPKGIWPAIAVSSTIVVLAGCAPLIQVRHRTRR